MLLVIPHVTVTPLRTIHITTLLHLVTHPLHILGIHRVKLAADGKGRYRYFGQILRAVPVDQPPTRFELTRTLHRYINALTEMLEAPAQRLRPIRQPAQM